jgi:hypothetical protein
MDNKAYFKAVVGMYFKNFRKTRIFNSELLGEWASYDVLQNIYELRAVSDRVLLRP